jgi:hypothetical protein
MFLYNTSKYSRYTKISWSIKRVISQCLSRSKNDVQILNRSLDAAKCSQITMSSNAYLWIMYSMALEFRSIVQARYYNLRKLSGIISKAKRRMERYERYNSFNKEIILNCFVFCNNILTCWHFDYISLILVKSSGIWKHAQRIDT